MPSMDALLVERRDHVRELAERAADTVPPVTDPPTVEGDGGGDDDGPTVETFTAVTVDGAPTDRGGSARGLRASYAALPEPFRTALEIIAVGAVTDAVTCWVCGAEVGWVTSPGQPGLAEWLTVILVTSADPVAPVNPMCGRCGPLVSHWPLDPAAAVLTAGGWVGDGKACADAPDGRRLHVRFGAGDGRCACGCTEISP